MSDDYKGSRDFQIADLQAAVWALESWLDAFGEDGDHDSEDGSFTAERVRRAYEGLKLVVDRATDPDPVTRQRHLRLVKPEDVN